MTDITEKLLDFSGEVDVLIAASDEIQQLRQQVNHWKQQANLWRCAAQAFEMGMFDTGNLWIDKARGGSDFIKGDSHD